MTPTLTHDQIVTIVLGAIAEESGESPALNDTLIDDLALGSLNFLRLALTLEERLSIGPIPDDDLFRLQTVNQVVCYCEAYLRKQEEVAAAVTAES